MSTGNFTLNIVDVPVYFKYQTEPTEEQYGNFDFVFLGNGTVLYNKPEKTESLKNFLVEDVIRLRVQEQTGQQFKVIAVSIS